VTNARVQDAAITWLSHTWRKVAESVVPAIISTWWICGIMKHTTKRVTLLRPSGYCVLSIWEVPHSVHRVHLYILYGSQNKQRLAITFPYTINWSVFMTQLECVYCAVWTESLGVIQLSLDFHFHTVSEGRADETWELSNKVVSLPPANESASHFTLAFAFVFLLLIFRVLYQ
jgi:hypothetical protein